MPPRAPNRLPSISKIPTEPPSESKYSDRFKAKVMPKPEPKLDITSATDFPTLGRSPIVMPNMVIMPKNTISFADKVKQMALAEATTKAQAEAERIRKQQEDFREQLEQNRYVPFHSTPSIKARPEDTWDTNYEEDEWTPGTPEFGREEFLHEDDGWSNT